MKKTRFFIICTLVFLCGCGYVTRSVISTGDASVYVDNFVNKIDITQEISDEKPYYAYRPAVESDITRAIIDRFIFDGNYRIKESESAHFMLKGELVDFRRDPLRYDTNENIIEYRISVAVNMEFQDLKEKALLWQERNFAGESTYRTTGEFAKSENVAVEEAITDLARRVIARAVENW